MVSFKIMQFRDYVIVTKFIQKPRKIFFRLLSLYYWKSCQCLPLYILPHPPPNSGIKYGPTYYIFSKMRQPRVKERIATKSSFSKKKRKKLSQKPFRCKKIWWKISNSLQRCTFYEIVTNTFWLNSRTERY